MTIRHHKKTIVIRYINEQLITYTYFQNGAKLTQNEAKKKFKKRWSEIFLISK